MTALRHRWRLHVGMPWRSRSTTGIVLHIVRLMRLLLPVGLTGVMVVWLVPLVLSTLIHRHPSLRTHVHRLQAAVLHVRTSLSLALVTLLLLLSVGDEGAGRSIARCA